MPGLHQTQHNLNNWLQRNIGRIHEVGNLRIKFFKLLRLQM